MWTTQESWYNKPMKFHISHPLKQVVINQKFGEVANLQYYKDHGLNFIGHNGVDYGATHGTPVYATHDGIVGYAGGDAKAGIGVVLVTNEKFDSPKDSNFGQTLYKTIYWHLAPSDCHGGAHKVPVTFGQQVKKGDIIGYVNNTGLSTGDHLHFGCKQVMEGEEKWTWFNLNQNNGYSGAIDPLQFIEPFSRDLFLGSTGPDVSLLQAQLVIRGFLLTKDFGTFGPKTFAAVRAFQKAYLLPATGYFGRMTRGKLTELMDYNADF